MRDLPPEFLNEMAKRGPINAKTMVVFVARNRETNAEERMCLWNGDDHQEFNVEGTTETFYGAGSIMAIDNIKQEIGTQIRKFSITLSNLTPEVAMLIRGYNVKFAQCRVYTILLSPESGLQVTPPLRRFKGWVDKAPISTARKGGTSTAKIEMVNVSRNLSKLVPSRKSDENQKQRNASDAFFSYVAITGNIQTPWGSENIQSEKPAKKTVLGWFDR